MLSVPVVALVKPELVVSAPPSSADVNVPPLVKPPEDVLPVDALFVVLPDVVPDVVPAVVLDDAEVKPLVPVVVLLVVPDDVLLLPEVVVEAVVLLPEEAVSLAALLSLSVTMVAFIFVLLPAE